MNGVLSGSGGLNLVSNSSGILELTAANSYTDGTTLTSGTLVVGTDSNLGAAAGSLTFNGGTLENTNAFTSGRTITLNAGGGTFQTDANLEVSGPMSGTGGLNKTGSGTLTLTNANTHSGGTTISAGTLQIGNGGATGSISGNITDNGLLAFDRSDATVFGGAISGTGGLEQRGTGTLTLTGGNTYTGGTTISAGTLQIGNGGATGGIIGNITDNGLLAFDRSDATVFGGAISGTGGLEQRGAGTLTLIGENTYTGGTTISAGTLQIGNGGVTGGIIGNITDNGLLVFDRSDATVFGGAISGTGGLEQSGTGTLTLTGGNTYTGGTTISAGTLQIGNGGATGGIIGNITDNGLLAFDRSDATVFGGAMQRHREGLEQRGAGTLTLIGENTYTGGTTISAGTLQIGNSGAAGSIASDVANAGLLAFNRSDSTAFEGAVSGTGGLEQRGAGTLTLIGENTYTGGTTISAGTLQIGNGSASGSISGNITDNGLLAFNHSGATVFGGVVSGSGGLEQRGTGSLTLTGGNTYTGGTTISAGTLQIGNGGATGGIIGNITDNGLLAFDRSDATVFGGAISGTGGLEQRGAGTLTLIGENTYTGGTTISAGTLQIGNGGTAGSIMGNIVDNGTLAFNHSNNTNYAGVLSGTGTLNKEGAGTLMLTGDSSSFTGHTFVKAGTLAVNGSLGGALDINSVAKLQGTGTVTSSVVAGTIAPGNSIGTIHVNNNYTQLTGSRYNVEVGSSGKSDLISVAGQANILGGTVAAIPTGAGELISGTRYTILTAKGGRIGQYDTLLQTLPFLNLSLAYDANNVYLDLLGRNSAAFCDAAVTRNECAAGKGAESLGLGNPIYDAIAGLPNAAAARRAFNSLSGEIHASLKSIMIEDSRFIREAVSDRTRQALTMGAGSVFSSGGQAVQGMPGTGRTFWTRALGSFGQRNGDGNAAQINRSIAGFFMGSDILIADRFLLGIAAGYSNSSFRVSDVISTSSSDNYHLSGYGGTQWGPLGLRVGAAHAWHVLQTNRSIVFANFADHTKGNYTGGTTQVFGELGYTLPVNNIFLEPFVRAAYVHFDTKRFEENGGVASLQGFKSNEGTTYTTVGLNAAKTFSSPGTVTTTLRGMLGWRRALGNLTPLSTFTLDSGSSFGIAGLPIVRDAMILSGGLDANITKAATVGIYYSGQMLSHILDNGVRANFNWRF